MPPHPRFTIPSRPTEERERRIEGCEKEGGGVVGGRWCSGLGSSGSGHLCGHCVWDRDDGRAGADVGLCARSHRGDACSVKATDTFKPSICWNLNSISIFLNYILGKCFLTIRFKFHPMNIVIYSPSHHFKMVRRSSVKHKIWHFEKYACFCPYHESQWGPILSPLTCTVWRGKSGYILQNIIFCILQNKSLRFAVTRGWAHDRMYIFRRYIPNRGEVLKRKLNCFYLPSS